MILIGVTGGIGSGKSTVCSLFEKKGNPIFFADIVAKEIINSNGVVLQEIIDSFGNQVLDSSKKLNRKILAEIVFENKKLLDELNAIVHPRVFESFEQWKKQLPSKCVYALIESALLFESGFFELLDYSLAVIANDDERIMRVTTRDSVSVEQVTARMKQQISTEELLELSDFQIQNNGMLTDLSSKVNFFHTLFCTLTSPKAIE
ncbi:MAG: dephospho-CoA kinase [Bacteroidota bacterium]|nr:dephospho-CoA kinase [Bacteroidota bacterium]